MQSYTYFHVSVTTDRPFGQYSEFPTESKTVPI